MPRFRAVLFSGIALTVLHGAGPLVDPIVDEGVYVNCVYRVAAIFPAPPESRDFTYTVARRSVPARQFFLKQGDDTFSITVADFTNGPATDENLVTAATMPLHQKGEVRVQYAEPYEAGIPGRQLDIFQPDGRQLRASIYMADHRLYITEAVSAPGDFRALRFEQSVSLIDASGIDFDTNNGRNYRQFSCRN
jgi:hypothetical protein